MKRKTSAVSAMVRLPYVSKTAGWGRYYADDKKVRKASAGEG